MYGTLIIETRVVVEVSEKGEHGRTIRVRAIHCERDECETKLAEFASLNPALRKQGLQARFEVREHILMP